ncbi:MAG: PorV/PorQ family protein [Calditrichia bacterium]
MKRLFNTTLLLFATLWAGSAGAQVRGFDQVGTTSFQFLTVIPNARASAMGGVASTTINTSEAVFFNPAALSRTSRLEAGVAYLDYFSDVTVSSFSGSYTIGNFGTFAVQAQVLDYGEIQETRADQLFRDPATGIFNLGFTGSNVAPSAMLFGISYARRLTTQFSFGLTAKYAYEDLIVESSGSVIFDGGILFKTGLRSLDFGMMLRNFGPEVKYVDEGYPLPQIFAIGLSGMLLGDEGDAFLMPSEDHNVLFAYDLAQTRDHSQQQHLGVEYSYRSLISLRSGYKVNFDEESWTAGFGINVNRFKLDYSYNDFGEFLGNVQRFTFNFELQ